MRTCLRLCTLLLACLLVPAHAHRLDEYLQSTTIRIAPGRVALHLRLVPGVDVARQVWDGIDRDADGSLSNAEQQAYVTRVLHDLALTVDGNPAVLSVVTWSFPARADLSKGSSQISLGLDTQMTTGAGTHRLRLVSKHRPAPSVYIVNTLVPVDDGIRVTGQRRSADQAEYEVDLTLGAR
jgi:hypothetical protein